MLYLLLWRSFIRLLLFSLYMCGLCHVHAYVCMHAAFFLCTCVVCVMCIHMFACTHVCPGTCTHTFVCTWGTEIDTRCSFNEYPLYLTISSFWTQSTPVLASRTGQFATEPGLCLLSGRMTSSCLTCWLLCEFWGSELRSLHLCTKWFIHCSISPALKCCFIFLLVAF